MFISVEWCVRMYLRTPPMMFSTTLNTEGNGTQMSLRPLTLEDLQSTQMLVTTHVRAVLVSICTFKGLKLHFSSPSHSGLSLWRV